MSLNSTPRSNRMHIAIFGRRNAGKSSLINAVTGQDIAVVSPVCGTTTDPVYKSMEILPVGPVVLIDTAGLDDEGELGQQRIRKTMDVLSKTDLAVLVVDAEAGVDDFEKELIDRVKSRNINIIGVINKTDRVTPKNIPFKKMEKELGIGFTAVSSLNGEGIEEFKKAVIKAIPQDESRFGIVGDLLSPGDFVVLVVPIDSGAPKGRLILPQQQVIRDIIENDAMAVVTREYKLKETLKGLEKKLRMVITDSQVFSRVAADTPDEVPLTSFSILFARHKGDIGELVKGARVIDRLDDCDRVLIAEACTHHRQCEDIGSVKIPNWLRQWTGKRLQFDFASGVRFPDNLGNYSLIVHCGGCMLNRRAMIYRIEQAVQAGVPIVNYGVLIAFVHGILERATGLFPGADIARKQEK